MHQSPDILASFGDWETRMERALASVRAGRGVLVVDDEDRENEGDLIYPAHSLTDAQMARLIRHCSGIVCLCLTDERATRLGLPPMVAHNTNTQQTAFTITVKAAVAEGARPEDLRHPGHVFPLRARPGGVLERRGHTEATVDLMSLAGLPPCGVLCELTNDDGTMARLPQVADFARANDLPLLAVADIVRWRERQEGRA